MNIHNEYKKQFIEDMIEGMTPILNNEQLQELNKSLNKHTALLNFGANPNENDLGYEEYNKMLIKEFEKSKKLEGCSERTCEYYRTTLEHLEKWVIKKFTNLTSNDLKDYLLFYQELRNCSNVTLNSNRRIISSFYSWMTDEEYIIINPMKRVPVIKHEKKIKRAFTDEEIEKMREYLNSKDYKTEYQFEVILRNKAIFELLLSSGIRVGELVKIKLNDLNLDEHMGQVLGKGNKERIIYYSESAKQLIEKFLKNRNVVSPFVFTNFGKGNRSDPITINGVEKMIRDLGRTCDIEAHPHKFRRTFSTNLIRKGMPITQVQQLLGHASLEVTLRYVETSDDLLQMTHRKYAQF